MAIVQRRGLGVRGDPCFIRLQAVPMEPAPTSSTPPHNVLCGKVTTIILAARTEADRRLRVPLFAGVSISADHSIIPRLPSMPSQ